MGGIPNRHFGQAHHGNIEDTGDLCSFAQPRRFDFLRPVQGLRSLVRHCRRIVSGDSLPSRSDGSNRLERAPGVAALAAVLPLLAQYMTNVKPANFSHSSQFPALLAE